MSPSTAPNKPGSEPGAAGWRGLIVVAVAVTAYALLSHWLMVHAADHPWSVAVLFAPLALAVAATGWRRKQPLILLACAAGVAYLAWLVTHGGVVQIGRMYVLQHGAMHLALAWGFAVTLRPGGTPMITTLARGVHGALKQPFTPEMVVYTRALTKVWMVYFVIMVVLSLLIYALAPWEWWSLFANLATPLSAAALMVGEHIQRYRLHPDFPRVSLQAAVNAYRQHGQPEAPR